MTSCKKNQDRLFDLLAGELPEDEAKDLEEHLATCNKCQVFFEELKIKHDFLRENAQVLNKLLEEPCPDPEVLIAFAENSLNRRKTTEVKNHLEKCSPCRKAVSALKGLEVPFPPQEESFPARNTSNTFYCLTTAEASEQEPPEWFLQAVRDAFPEKKPKRPWWKRFWFRT